MRDPLSVALRLMAPFVRARAGALVGAAALLVAYSAVAVSPALITQRLIDRDLAAGDVSLVVALALLLVLASGAQSALSVLLVRLLSAMGEGVAADVSILLIVLSKITQYNEQNYSVPCGGAVCTSALR
ncbi:putative membrane protein YdfJ with MMPL/SSD domain [Olsenella profusa DSM 13989]|uniref:hypothetical protein n=1 Tax=Olsenella profusa TaxID=138595 RepID=UPI0027812D35|nr:hypothetical protein [Olsenella profusa]MDP9859653.1 putative membrane protein YdfJ with MMPL/SSD domain [Olsenella profusa DSM 13989]